MEKEQIKKEIEKLEELSKNYSFTCLELENKIRAIDNSIGIDYWEKYYSPVFGLTYDELLDHEINKQDKAKIDGVFIFDGGENFVSIRVKTKRSVESLERLHESAANFVMEVLGEPLE